MKRIFALRRQRVFFLRYLLFEDNPRRALKRLLGNYETPEIRAIVAAFSQYLVTSHSEENLAFFHA